MGLKEAARIRKGVCTFLPCPSTFTLLTHPLEKDKPEVKDFLSKGPVQANAEDYPPARSKEELKAEAERLNQK
jgi:hypothetical protein